MRFDIRVQGKELSGEGSESLYGIQGKEE